MKCSKCNNTKDFIVLGNQNFRVNFSNGHLGEIKKEDFNITDTYPVICGKCRSEDIDFNYLELEEIFSKVK